MVQMYSFFADLILFVHTILFVFIVGGELFIVTGGLLNYKIVRNMSFRMSHIAAMVYVAFEALLGIDCPLTVWERDFRIAAGQFNVSDLSFTAQLFQKIIFYDFPPIVFKILHPSFALLIVITFFIFPPRTKGS